MTGIELDEPATLHTKDHASFQTAWEDFRERKGGTLPGAVAMAVAGPVKPDVIPQVLQEVGALVGTSKLIV